MAYLVEARDPLTQSRGVEEGYAATALRWPSQPLQRRPKTASELAGPGNVLRRLAAVRGDLAGHGDKRAIGQLIHLRTRVVDEDGTPVRGAAVEIWHCNAAGKYIHPNDSHDAPADPNFYGAARMVADDEGLIELRTIKPGAYPVPESGGWWRPPHVHFSVWGRVWLSRLVTQMFFPGEPLNELDPILNAVREPQARAQCIARLAPTARGPENALVYEYQLVVRGRQGTAQLP
ncbi:MAG TPA: protocatechuate 3,4-dioxygenase subunit beta [Burkholderiales bacterium]|jgi:protocatechuate 3,4-dioxygenase beta subunit|nr:protocatechuate 3,4-dioxygenase subunit beta [Burkholderiales bacterium]